MTGTIILLIVLLMTFLLGRYAIKQGHRVEEHKKFLKNLKDYDNKRKNT